MSLQTNSREKEEGLSVALQVSEKGSTLETDLPALAYDDRAGYVSEPDIHVRGTHQQREIPLTPCNTVWQTCLKKRS
jgi:hypothetical protein